MEVMTVDAKGYHRLFMDHIGRVEAPVLLSCAVFSNSSSFLHSYQERASKHTWALN